MENGFCQLLHRNLGMDSDSQILKTILEALSNILAEGKSPESSHNVFQASLEVSGIINQLEELQLHPNEGVYDLVINIIEAYFEVLDPL